MNKFITRIVFCLSLIFWVNGVSAAGILEVVSNFYDQDNEYEPENVTLEGIVSYEFNWQLSERGSLLFKPRMAYDTGELYSQSAVLHEKNRTRSTFAIEEFTYTHYFNNLEVTLGKQIFSWGQGDMYNPSDRINSIDSLDPLNNIKLGQWATSFLYLGSTSNINVIVIPRRTASRLPEQNNRWFRSLDAVEAAAEAQLGFIPNISLERESDNDHPSIGIQITSGQWIPGWDIELSYFHSQDDIGVYLPALNGNVLDLIRTFPRFNEASIGFSTAVGEYTFHGISVYRNTQNNQQDDDYFTFLLGGRRAFYAPDYYLTGLIQSLEEFTLSLEYVNENISHDRDVNSAFVNTGFGRTLTNSLLLNLEFKFIEEISLTFGLVQNFEPKNRYVSMEVSHQVNDDLSIKMGLGLLSGSPDTLFGQWSHNDRFFINTSYNF